MMQRELIIDSFAGGGGASTGIKMALGRSPDIAINHDAEALAMHRVNHPETLHIVEDVWHVDFKSICAGRPIGLLWLSPDCTHFSKAKGGKPREKELRGLAWVSLKWVKSLPVWQRPRVIALENVEEFQDWGPLTDDNKPCRKQKGLFFNQFRQSFEAMGYRVEARVSRAYEALAPTIRRRLLVIMRRDGEPIVWPEALAGDPNSATVQSGQVKPWKTAAACIDFTRPCPSIFATSAEIKAEHGIRANRPLADNSMARIAKGVKRHVLDAGELFIVNLTHGGRVECASEPLRTVTGAHRGEKAVVVPSLIQTGYGERPGQMPRVLDIGKPLGTVVAGGIKHALVQPYLLNLKGSARRDSAMTAPAPTVCAGGWHLATVTPFLTKFRSGAIGSAITVPMPTVTANSWIKKPGGAVPIGVITPVLTAAQHGGSVRSVTSPMHTVCASRKDQNSIIVPYLVKNYTGVIGASLGVPLGTATAIDHHALAAPFFVKYYGVTTGQDIAEPLHTATMKARFGFVWPKLSGPALTAEQIARARQVADFLRAHDCWDDREFVTVEIAGETYIMVDIGLRMLIPRELFRAQGFPETYIIDRGIDADGNEIRLSNTAQIEKCGNSVSPPWAAWHIGPNFSPRYVDVPESTDFGPLFGGVAA